MNTDGYSDAAFALVLYLAALVLMFAAGRARTETRGYARLAGVFYIAFVAASAAAFFHAGAAAGSFAAAIALLADAMAPAALALALAATFARSLPPWLAGGVLLCGLGCGLAAVLGGGLFFALAPLVLSAGAILSIGLARVRDAPIASVYLCVSALALLAAAGASLEGSRAGYVLFTAVSLMGFAFVLLRSGNLVEKARGRGAPDAAVLRKR